MPTLHTFSTHKDGFSLAKYFNFVMFRSFQFATYKAIGRLNIARVSKEGVRVTSETTATNHVFGENNLLNAL